jgi:hypothetical protein
VSQLRLKPVSLQTQVAEKTMGNISYLVSPLQSKVKSCPCAHNEGIHGSQGIVPLVINLDTRQGEWSASHPGCLVLWKERPVPSEEEAG